MAASGARIHAATMANGPMGLLRLSLPPPKKKANRTRNVIDMAMPAAIEPIRMSWL